MAVTIQQQDVLHAVGALSASRQQIEKRCQMTPSVAAVVIGALMRRNLLTVAEGSRERYVATERGRRLVA